MLGVSRHLTQFGLTLVSHLLKLSIIHRLKDKQCEYSTESKAQGMAI